MLSIGTNRGGPRIEPVESLRTSTPSSGNQHTLLFGHSCCSTFPAMLTIQQAVMEQLSNWTKFLLTYFDMFTTAEGLDVSLFSAIASILALLAASILRRRQAARKSFQAKKASTHKHASIRLLKRQCTPVLKRCPGCAEQLPLSAIICDKCDYNFLVERSGRRPALLPPQALVNELPDQKVVCR